MKIAFVILNFNSSKATIKLVHEIIKQPWSKEVGIYIIDNCSDESDRQILQNSFSRFKNTFVKTIYLDQNHGYAKGNNYGISLARKEGFDTIVVTNPDISFLQMDNFKKVVQNIILRDSSIAIIAPSILNYEKIDQNPFRVNRFTKKELIKMKIFYILGIYKVYFLLRVYIFFKFGTYLAKLKNSRSKNYKKNIEISGRYIYAPHGSFLIMTPTFFKKFDGFDPNTFLYCEEFILAEKLYQAGLRIYYEPSIKVLHKSSGSTDVIVKNYYEKVKFTLKHTLQSCRYFMNVIGWK